MKHKLLCAILLCSFFYANGFATNDTSFTIQGNLRGYGDGVIIITYTDPNEKVKPDTIQVVNDKFIFKGTLESPLMAYMKIMDNGKLERDYYRIDFLIENSPMFINGDIRNPETIQLTGSKSNELYHKMAIEGNQLNQAFRAAKKKLNSGAEDEHESELLERQVIKKREAYLNFLLNYNNFYSSHAGAYVLWLFSKHISWQRLENILPNFDPEIKNNTFLQYMERKVMSARRILPGKLAPDFTVKDLSGKEYSLEDFRGNYLLMTFSASWCGPCKYEYPYLVKAFNEYSPRGLNVIIINLDVSKELWRSDVEEYDFPFPVLSNLQAFDGTLTKNYGVLSIPKVFLIDPDGEIVSNSIRQQGILKKLVEVYR